MLLMKDLQEDYFQNKTGKRQKRSVNYAKNKQFTRGIPKSGVSRWS